MSIFWECTFLSHWSSEQTSIFLSIHGLPNTGHRLKNLYLPINKKETILKIQNPFICAMERLGRSL